MDVVIILDALPNRENMLVYAKPLQIYKGIDNKIKLLIKNQDRLRLCGMPGQKEQREDEKPSRAWGHRGNPWAERIRRS